MTATVTAPVRAPRVAAGPPMATAAPRLLPRAGDLKAVYELDEFDGIEALYHTRAGDGSFVPWTSWLWTHRAPRTSRFIPEGGRA